MSETKAKRIIERNKALKSDRSHWDSVWQDVADYVMPRKSQVTSSKTPDVEGYTDEIYDTEAIHDNITLGAGQLDYLVSGRWFEFQSPNPESDQDVKDWYKRVSEVTLEVFNASNFNLEVHEFFLDRGGFGTAHLHLEEDEEDVFCFINAEVGTFSVSENHKGIVDTIYREFKLTARQAEQKFGKENLSPKLLEALNSKDASKGEDKFDFIHSIEPRPQSERETGKIDGPNKAIGSTYVCVADIAVVRDGGYDEMPSCVSRFLKWGKSAYGYCPSIEALPTVKQLNFIEKNMDALGELAAFPRVLIPDALEGDVDLRAAGITIFDPNSPNAIPREWATEGRYDIGKDRAEIKRDMIRRAYFTDLFQMLTSLDEVRREKTAYEVQAMLQEKLSRISPTFERMKVEVFKPVLNRAFSICYRRGLYPTPPASVIRMTASGAAAIDYPKVNYVSKLAMAIKQAQNNSFYEWWQMASPILEVDPTAIDELNTKSAFRQLGDNQGVPSAFWNTDKEKRKIADERKQAQEAAAMVEAAPALGKAASDFSKAI